MNPTKKELQYMMVAEPGDIPSTKQVAEILAALIKQVREALKLTQDEIKKNYISVAEDAGKVIMSNVTQDIKVLEESLRESILKLEGVLLDNSKLKTNEWYKALSNAVYTLEKQIEDIVPFSPKQLEAEWTLIVHEINAKIDAIKPFVLIPTEVRDSLETLKEEERLDASAIKGLEKYVREIVAAIKSTKTNNGGAGLVGARELVRAFDLSSYLNGVTKTFSLPAVWRIISVQASSFPGVLRETVDYTWTPQSITFTSEIDAAGTLAIGQTVIILYMSA